MSQPLPPLADLAATFGALLAQVSALHAAGRLHGGILAEGSGPDAVGPATIGPPAERIVLPGGTNPSETTPPELAARPSWELSVELAAARAELAAAGVAADPRRIDVYQLGVLLCRLASGRSSRDYLRSPKVRGLVPPALRPVIDAALGHYGPLRLSDCSALAALLAAAADPDSLDWSDDTLATGTQSTPALPPAPGQSVEPALVVEGPAGDSAASSVRASLSSSRLGSYRILDRIGGGGMGDVYRAYDEFLNRFVAVKVLSAELARHPDFVRRFRAEAQAIAGLRHSNIVRVHVFGEDAGRHFFAMDFIHGESLADLLRRRKRLPAAEALPIFEQCLAGLAAAHESGLVHRDIKPGNILLDHEHHQALVADFGLVKMADSGESLTASGLILGTVDYLSPEQARGEHVDARSDLYSMGALMYQTLSGQLPLVADSIPAMAFQHTFEQPRSLAEVAPDVPGPLAAIVMRLISSDPAQRYQEAAEVLADLAAFRLEQRGIGAAVEPTLACAAAIATGGPAGSTDNSAGAAQSAAPREPEQSAAARLDFAPPRPLRRRWGALGAGISAAALLLLLVLSDRRSGGERPAAEAISPFSAANSPEAAILPAGAMSERRIQGVQPRTPADEVQNGSTPDLDRSVAQWVLASGGRVRLFVHRKLGPEIESVSQLPSGPWSLGDIWLYQRKAVTDVDLVRLEGLPALVKLNLLGTSVTDAGLEHLQGLGNLEALDLTLTQITGSGLRHLSGLKKPQQIALTKSSVTDEGLADFPPLEHLRQLDVYHTRLTRLDFVRRLKGLESLNIGDTRVQDLSPLAGSAELGVLNLWGTCITDDQLAHLTSLKKLTWLGINENSLTDACLPSLEAMTGLQHLLLDNTHLTAAGIARLQAALPQCTITWGGKPLAGGKPATDGQPAAEDLE